MNISVPELSQRLQKALDKDYNVKDEKSVYEIISVLEGTRVTREMLEATRLAKHINELRKKTKDQALARRSKSLLKRWREMLLPAAPSATAAAGGGMSANQLPVTNRTSVSASSNLVPHQQQHSRQTAVQFNQNGSMSSRPPPPNNRAPFISQQSQPPGHLIGQQASLLSLHNISNNSSSLSSSSVSRISPNKLAALSHHHQQQQQQQHQQQMYNKHKENHQDPAYMNDVKKLAQFPYNNNNSLRIPSASSSRPGFAVPMEIINLTDDRSNSPSLFQQITSKRSHSASPKVVRMHNDNSMDRPNSIATTSANSKSVSLMTAMLPNTELTATNKQHGLPLGIMMQNSKSMTCDNEYDSSNNIIGTSSSRKHKKHKKEKKGSTQKTNYNHLDERSAPNMLTTLDENSLNLAHHNANSLILPDNDSLSNTSASIFNINNTHADTGSCLSFAGHFSKAKSNNLDVGAAAAAAAAAAATATTTATNLIPIGATTSTSLAVSRPGSRSVSPSIFISQHSNHSITSVGNDPDVVIINNSRHASPVPSTMPSANSSQDPTQVKIPKKRGRKKGSKGIDSLLATHNEGTMASILNADSFSDLKQKITSISGMKKVKTTKELLADIQNKRSTSGNISTVTSPSVTQAPSPESLSEISHHSQSTDAGLRSLRASPEPSTSSALMKSETPTPQSEDMSLDKKTETREIVNALPKSGSTFVVEDIEVTIRRLMAHLPPIDFTVLDKTEDEEQLPKCTCTLQEAKEGLDENEGSGSGGGSGHDGTHESNRKVDNLVNIEVNIIKDSDEEMADAEMRERLKTRVKKKKREKTVKSIFDLDDDNEDGVGEMNDSDDDDLESVPDEVAPKDAVSAMLAAGESLSQQNAPVTTVPTNANFPDEFAPPVMPQFTKYEAVIDANCAAMRFYETDRNDVTNFHIEHLHNGFVPNVNGNWNHRNVPDHAQNNAKTEPDTVSIDTANHVVPWYNYLSCDKIPKQFNDFQFDYKSYVAHRKDRDKRKLSESEDKKPRLFSDASSMEVDDLDFSYNNHHNNHHNLSEADEDSCEMMSVDTKPTINLIENEDVGSDAEQQILAETNNGKLPSFNELTADNETGHNKQTNTEFSEWYKSVHAVSVNEDLIILPYVVID